MNDILVVNAELVSEGRRWHADLRIRDGRIDEIAANLPARERDTVIDASGKWLLPGMIDDQVHFRDPGLTWKGDVETESRAAVVGGITSFMDMPNTKPTTTNAEALAAKHRRGAEVSRGNYAFYMGATNDNLGDIQRMDPKASPGVKIFMGASTGNMLVNDPDILDAFFRDTPTPIITHCEDTPMIEANVAEAKRRWPNGIPIEQHPVIRSREACIKSTRLAIELARRHNARLHVLHISTADELALFEPGPVNGKRITAETCVHFLQFDESDYPRLGNFIKCNPAIKSASDRMAIIAAVAESRIDVLATDHAPHTLEEKQQPYEAAPAGLPLVQFAVQSALERVHAGQITLERLVEAICHAPAQLFNVKDRGFLREGAWADLILVDPKRPQTVHRSDVLSRCGWSPYEGMTFQSSIASTFINGHPAWHDGKLDDSVRGQALEFDR